MSETRPIRDAHHALDPTMVLTYPEYNKAVAIRQAVDADERCTNVSDYECVQYALSCPAEETMESIVQRVYTLQAFREEYKLQDNLAEGIQIFNLFTLQHPGFILTIEFLHSSQNYICIRDLAAYHPSTIKTDQQLRIFLCGLYYIFQCENPTFSAIRNGMTSLTECMDATFDNYNPKILDKFMHELLHAYPKNQREAYFLNTATVVNFMHMLWKPFLPDKIMKVIHLGHKVDGLDGRKITPLYMSPTPEMARNRVVLRVAGFLQLRYHHQDTFKLENCARVS